MSISHVMSILTHTVKGHTIFDLHVSHESRYNMANVTLITVSAELNSAALLLVRITSESDESELNCSAVKYKIRQEDLNVSEQ